MQVHLFESQEERLNFFYEQYGWNGKFFLLTRDNTVEITETGEDDYSKKGTLFFYANQVLCGSRPGNEHPDEFGRNYLDQVFIALCIRIQGIVAYATSPKTFKSLTTRKDGDKYLARVRYDDVDLEMEVEEMYRYFCNLTKQCSP